MKLQFSFFVLLTTCFFLDTCAQQFTWANGPISTTPSDSRSVNFLDLNNDGWEDVYISNGLKGGQQDLLYLNDGTGKMNPVTTMPIVQASNPADGACFVDYNNDGHVDGVVSSWYGSEDLLYLNDGNGQLQYNGNAGIASGSFAENAAFGDYDQDGWLDLYISNSGGNQQNYLYRNLQNGKFQRITTHPLIQEAKLSRGATWVDYDNDGITDLFVANEDNTKNDLFRGKGNGVFEKITSGSLVSQSMGSMTASWGDIDNDGDFDVFVGNAAYFAAQRNQLFRNSGGGFSEIMNDPVSQAVGCTYGSAFGDFDNDGDLDLVTANGYCNNQMQNNLYENQGDGTFTDVTNLLIANANVCSFGIAWGDVNKDGFLDLVVANCKNNTADSEKSNALLLNKGNSNKWLTIKLKGTISNASAIGAKIRVMATINGKVVWQTREIRSQSGYAGQNSLVAHFGLGDAGIVDSLVISWPSGKAHALSQIAVDQHLVISETITNSLTETPSAAHISLHVLPNNITQSSENIWLLVHNSGKHQKGTVTLHNAMGQLIWKRKVHVERENTNISLPLAKQELSAGMYHITLIVGEQKRCKKVVIH